MIDAEEFQAAFYNWVRAVYEITQGQIISVDDKCMLGSEDERLGKRAIYMVSAWAEANHLGLGQRKVEAKSNEITAFPELLRFWLLQVVLSPWMPWKPPNPDRHHRHRSGSRLCFERQREPGSPV
jgi:hypothetical protein